VLDDLGLSAALERFADDFGQAHAIKLDVKLSGLDVCRLPENVETALYRIAQEALNNVAKHALARRVSLHVERKPGLVEMAVADDGCGFDCRTALADRGLGLSGMRERAALLDGAITIESKPGTGTRITARIPLQEVAYGEDSRAHCG
jgi:signal transduction histidine kinase